MASGSKAGLLDYPPAVATLSCTTGPQSSFQNTPLSTWVGGVWSPLGTNFLRDSQGACLGLKVMGNLEAVARQWLSSPALSEGSWDIGWKVKEGLLSTCTPGRWEELRYHYCGQRASALQTADLLISF